MNAAASQLQGGAYPLEDAARLARMRPKTVRRWVEGYTYSYRGEHRRSEGVPYLLTYAHTSKLATRRGSQALHPTPVLDFEQLLTLLLVRAFHERGLSLVKIKAASARAKRLYGLENPFVSKQFRSDGNRVFIDLDPHAQGRERQMIDVLSDQRQFRDLVEPSLFRDLVFIGDRAGQWWPLGPDRSVVVAPGHQFGQPHVSGTGVRTDVIAELVQAEGAGQQGVDAAGVWFGLTPVEVRDALDFEESLTRLPS